MKKRILSGILSAAMFGTSVYSVPFVSALTSEGTRTPGIEMWANPSGTFRCIEGVSFDDLITSFGEGAFVYRYSNNKKAVVVTPEGKTYHFSEYQGPCLHIPHLRYRICIHYCLHTCKT